MPRKYKPKNEHLKEETKNKEGRFSKEELKFIEDNYEVLGIDEMSKHLHRSEQMVEQKLVEVLRDKKERGEKVNAQVVLEHDLKKMPFFPMLKKQYDKDELMIIEFQWNRLHGQFQDDVQHSEQMQILSYCKTLIDLDRLGVAEKKSNESVADLEAELNFIKEKLKVQDDIMLRQEANMLMQMISDIRNSRRSVTEEKVKLGKQLADLTQALKGTRDQRIKIATEQQMNWTSLLKALDDEDFRKKHVRNNHLLKLSAEKERVRLAEDHQYMDGLIDKPILNSETVMEDEEI